MPSELHKEQEPKPEESIAERVKLRKQLDYKSPTTQPIPVLESDEDFTE